MEENFVRFTVDGEEHIFHTTEELDKFMRGLIDKVIDVMNEASDVRAELEEMQDRNSFREMLHSTYMNAHREKEEADEKEKNDDKGVGSFCDFLHEIIDDIERHNR